MEEALLGLGRGDEVRLDYAPGKAVPGWKEKVIRSLDCTDFRPPRQCPLVSDSRLGRFYSNRHVLHDLNIHPELPFADAGFDLVICSLSIEYVVTGRVQG